MSEPRPFRILGVQQIALGASDKTNLARLWVDLLGLERVGSYRSASENVDEDILRVGAGAFAIEYALIGLVAGLEAFGNGLSETLTTLSNTIDSAGTE